MLLPHAYCFTLLDGDLKRKTVAEYLELAGRVPVYSAVHGHARRAPLLLSEIERVLIREAA